MNPESVTSQNDAAATPPPNPSAATPTATPTDNSASLTAPVTAASTNAALRRWMLVLTVLALAGVMGSLLVWQKLANVQQQLARQSADSSSVASQARDISHQAEDLALQTAAKLSVAEAKLSEVALQRTQLEELMQSLSRSRDENLVVDIDSAVRLAQQQTQLTGSIEPLLAALHTADARIARAAQPRLAQLQRAIARDVGRIRATALADTPSLLIRLDELVAMVDDLPLDNDVQTNAVGSIDAPSRADLVKRQPEEKVLSWWERLGQLAATEVRNLVRVRHIEYPDAALLTPDQTFFVRENLKLRLLNARLGLLSRQIPAVRSDLATASVTLARYFDAASRKTQTAQNLLQQVRSQTQVLEIPRIDDTLAALATAAAGR